MTGGMVTLLDFILFGIFFLFFVESLLTKLENKMNECLFDIESVFRMQRTILEIFQRGGSPFFINNRA